VPASHANSLYLPPPLRSPRQRKRPSFDSLSETSSTTTAETDSVRSMGSEPSEPDGISQRRVEDLPFSDPSIQFGSFGSSCPHLPASTPSRDDARRPSSPPTRTTTASRAGTNPTIRRLQPHRRAARLRVGSLSPSARLPTQ
jgi:hypothetical protein